MRKSIHTEAYTRLRSWLREQRALRGITQRGLAGMLGVPHSWVTRVEQGERRVDIVEFLEICRVLRADPHAGLNRTAFADAYENRPQKSQPSASANPEPERTLNDIRESVHAYLTLLKGDSAEAADAARSSLTAAIHEYVRSRAHSELPANSTAQSVGNSSDLAARALLYAYVEARLPEIIAALGKETHGLSEAQFMKCFTKMLATRIRTLISDWSPPHGDTWESSPTHSVVKERRGPSFGHAMTPSAEGLESPLEAINKLVEQLEPKTQEIFRLRAKGATFEEMAVALSMQGGTIRKRHRRITQWLSTELNRLGHTA